MYLECERADIFVVSEVLCIGRLSHGFNHILPDTGEQVSRAVLTPTISLL